MKLQVDPKWKYICSYRDGIETLCTELPVLGDSGWFYPGEAVGVAGVFEGIDLGPWRESLHEILPDGTLRKCVPELPVDTKVLVGYPGDKVLNIKAHFARFYSNGSILCWDSGKTSFTANDLIVWYRWKLYEEDGEK